MDEKKVLQNLLKQKDVIISEQKRIIQSLSLHLTNDRRRPLEPCYRISVARFESFHFSRN